MEGELGWKVLRTLVASKLATKNDSEVVQVIAEHVALGEDNDDGRQHGTGDDVETTTG